MQKEEINSKVNEMLYQKGTLLYWCEIGARLWLKDSKDVTDTCISGVFLPYKQNQLLGKLCDEIHWQSGSTTIHLVSLQKFVAQCIGGLPEALDTLFSVNSEHTVREVPKLTVPLLHVARENLLDAETLETQYKRRVYIAPNENPEYLRLTRKILVLKLFEELLTTGNIHYPLDTDEIETSKEYYLEKLKVVDALWKTTKVKFCPRKKFIESLILKEYREYEIV